MTYYMMKRQKYLTPTCFWCSSKSTYSVSIAIIAALKQFRTVPVVTPLIRAPRFRYTVHRPAVGVAEKSAGVSGGTSTSRGRGRAEPWCIPRYNWKKPSTISLNDQWNISKSYIVSLLIQLLKFNLTIRLKGFQT